MLQDRDSQSGSSVIAKVTVDLPPHVFRKLLKLAMERHETVGQALSAIVAPLAIDELRQIRRAQIERRKSLRQQSRRRHKRR